VLLTEPVALREGSTESVGARELDAVAEEQPDGVAQPEGETDKEPKRELVGCKTVAVPLTVALPDAKGEALPLREGFGEALTELPLKGEPDAAKLAEEKALGEREALPQVEEDGVLQPLNVTVAHTESVVTPLPLPLSEEDAEGQLVPVGLNVSPPEALMLKVPLLQEDGEGDARVVPEAKDDQVQATAETEAVKVALAQEEGKLLPLTLSVALSEVEKRVVPEGVKDDTPDAVTPPRAGVALPHPDTKGEGVVDEDADGVLENNEFVEDAVVDAHALGRALKHALFVGHPDSDKREGDPLCEVTREADGWVVPLAEPETEAEAEGDRDWDGEGDVFELVGVMDTELHALGRPLKLALGIPLPVRVKDAEPLVHADTLGERENEEVTEELTEGARDVVALRDAEGHALVVPERLGEGVTDALPLLRPLALELTVGLHDRVGEPEPLAQTEALVEREGDPVDEALNVGVLHTVPPGVAEGHVLTVPERLGEGVTEALALPRPLALELTVGIDRVGDPEALRHSEALGEWEGAFDDDEDLEIPKL